MSFKALNSHPWPLIMLIIGPLLLACGRGGGSFTPATTLPEEEQSPQEPTTTADSFKQRLNANLLIAGNRCEGGEKAPDENGQQAFECVRGEWLVTVDNQNVCTGDGICTQIYVPPFVASLESIKNTTNYRYDEIRPNQPIDSSISDILNDYWVRFHGNGGTRVVRQE